MAEEHDRIIDRVALHLTYGATKKAIHDMFIKEGFTDEYLIYLLYKAGKLLAESRQNQIDPDATPVSGVRSIPPGLL